MITNKSTTKKLPVSMMRWIFMVLLFVCLAAFLLIGFNLILDPFGVFGDKVLEWDSYNMVNNPRLAKIAWLDKNPGKYDSFIIGGSKSSSLSPDLLNQYMNDASFYSMMIYGGDFFDYEQLLHYLVEQADAKNIVLHMSLQEISHYGQSSKDLKKIMHAKVTGDALIPFYARFLFMNPQYGLEKLEGYAKRSIDPFEYAQIIPEMGVYNKIRRDAEDLSDPVAYLNANPEFGTTQVRQHTSAIENNVAALARMKAYCEERGVHFVFVTGASHESELDRYDLDNLKKYWRMLASVTPFWDFGGYSVISGEPIHFYDPTHYRTHVGQWMLARIFGDDSIDVPQSFGHWTTPENVEAHAAHIFSNPEDTLQGIPIPILTYHHIDPDPARSNDIIITPDKFLQDMKTLKNAGFETVHFRDLEAYVNWGEPLPDKPVVVTFDDGYTSNWTYAWPVLKELDMKATISVIGWSVGQTVHKDTGADIIPHFSWEQAREMVASGHIDIQNHSHDMHGSIENPPYRQGVLQKTDESTEDYLTAVERDTMQLHEKIMAELGTRAHVYVFPGGNTNALLNDLLTSLGYTVTLTTTPGVSLLVPDAPESLLGLKRLNAGHATDSVTLLELITPP